MLDAHRWVRAIGKRPVRCDGRPASSTDPGTWASYAEVVKSTAGDGYGFMLGSGFACIDLDHCVLGEGRLNGRAMSALSMLESPVMFMEASTSGDGIHAFLMSSAPSHRRSGVEFYSSGRFIRMTGCPFLGRW